MSYSELLRMTSAGAGGIHRELQQFVRAGLVRARPVGGRRFYFPNEAHTIYEELRDIARKLLGIPALVKEALEPFSTQIERAFIYGSVARNAEDAESDIDVMVIGTPPMEKVLGALQELEPALRRHISARFYEPVEFHKLGASNAFLRRVREGATIELIEHAPLSKAAPALKADIAQGLADVRAGKVGVGDMPAIKAKGRAVLESKASA